MIRVLHSVGLTLADAVQSMIRERRWRLLPAFFFFLLLSLLLVVVKAISPIAPFVYSLF